MAVTNADILGWLNANPGASPELINKTMADAGVSAEQYLSATGTPPPTQNASQDVTAKLASQILASSDPSQWSGQGYGSAQANAADMAKILAGIGITDISQFGQVKGYQEVQPIGEYYNGKPIQPIEGANGQLNKYVIKEDADGVGHYVQVPENAKTQTIYGTPNNEGGLDPVDQSKLKTVNGKLVADTGQVAFGNKATGVATPNTYSERQTGNAFGGTFAGKGNTGYRVNFDAQGNPQFYTTGASSSNLKDYLAPLAVLAAPYAIGALGGAGLFGGATEGLGLSELLPGASNLATATNVADIAAGTEGGLLGGAGTVAGMGTGTGLTFSGAGGLGGSLGAAGLESGLGAGIGAGELGSTLAGLETGVGAGVLGSALGGLSTGVGAGLGGALAGGAASALGGAAANSLIDNAITSGLGLAGGVMQSQTSKEAAKAAAESINKATQAGVTGSQFRPVGMTTRFGTSNFTYDPVTGQMVSAGYQLSPEAKAAQDRLVTLAGQGLTQAEQAQKQFAPLQQGATNLFNLGNQYIQQSPEQVAQDYINKQMALLAPSRETAMANLANTLSSKGTTGLSIAQGGGLKAANPVAQAFANAQAMQDLQLAAQAQQAGQQNTLFGAGLLGQGSTAMGNYYGGQAQAYQPYTTALGQIQGLEAMGQQPFILSSGLGQIAANAGANAGRIGVAGAQAAGNILTSPAVTNNPYASFLGGLASPQSLLGQGIANWATGYNPDTSYNQVMNPYLTWS